MSFQKIFTCDNKKCNKEGIQLVVLQIRSDKKNNAVKVMARCPKCQKGYYFDLPLNDTDQWDPLLRANVFRCAHCGKSNVKVVESKGHPHRDYKIKVLCQSCHEQEERNVDGNLYYLVEDNVPANVTTTTPVTCPTCQSQIAETDTNCPNCGKDLHCPSCGSLLPETAHFCLKCGASVTGEAAAPPPETAATECPACGNPLSEGSKFCLKCGHEVACANCGNPLPTGAVFCNHCGEKVKTST
jgi:predicted RNA-binding Zn-ribbon protein involved in translation (DUF1610 family)